METGELIEKFENLTLPKKERTHLAHLTMALYYVLKEQDTCAALAKIRKGILSYNDIIGIANNDNSGYHETRTVFRVFTLKRFCEENAKLSAEELLEKLKSSPLLQKEYINGFYSLDILNSPIARAIFVPYHDDK